MCYVLSGDYSCKLAEAGDILTKSLLNKDNNNNNCTVSVINKQMTATYYKPSTRSQTFI